MNPKLKLQHNPVIYGMATVGERGQVVIPSEARQELGIKPGDKLLVIKPPVGKMVSFMKADDLTSHIKSMTQMMGKLEEMIKEEK
jgi:AbrB family looped-hinge helix DNA binding protein